MEEKDDVAKKDQEFYIDEIRKNLARVAGMYESIEHLSKVRITKKNQLDLLNCLEENLEFLNEFALDSLASINALRAVLEKETTPE